MSRGQDWAVGWHGVVSSHTLCSSSNTAASHGSHPSHSAPPARTEMGPTWLHDARLAAGVLGATALACGQDGRVACAVDLTTAAALASEPTGMLPTDLTIGRPGDLGDTKLQ